MCMCMRVCVRAYVRQSNINLRLGAGVLQPKGGEDDVVEVRGAAQYRGVPPRTIPPWGGGVE